MPQHRRKRVFKIPNKPFDAEKKGFEKNGSIPIEDKGVYSLKSDIRSLGDPNRSEQPLSLKRKVIGSNTGRIRILGGVLPKSKINVFLGKLHLKPRNVIVNKPLMHDTSFLNKEVSNPRIVTEALIQKEYVASRFLSILTGKGRVISHKAPTPVLGGKLLGNSEEAKRLSYAQKLKLFQALVKEPLPFLEIHGRFGISKQAIKRLVRNGLLTEMWGPKAVGVRFKLSKKGNVYLKELEAAAKFEPKIEENVFIRLKHRASV